MRTKLSQTYIHGGEKNEMDFTGLNSYDMDEVQAAFDAVIAVETQGMISCSCCTELFTTSEELHYHQISIHSIEELSFGLISLRGIDLQFPNFDIVDPIKEEIESKHLHDLLLDSEALRSPESDGETTLSVNSESRMTWMALLNNSDTCDAVSNEVVDSHEVNNYQDDIAVSPVAPVFDCQLDVQHTQSYRSTCPNHLAYFTDFNGNIKQEKEEESANVAAKAMYTVPENSRLRSLLTSSGGGILYDNWERRDQNDSSFISSGSFSDFSHKVPSENSNVISHPQDDKMCLSLYPRQAYKEEIILQSESSCQSSSSSLGFTSTRRKGTKDNPRTKTKCPRGRGNPIQNQNQHVFVCFFCGKLYKKKSHLERHIRSHTGEKPYPCPVCSKRFSIRSVLKQHLRVHTGEKPFSCTVCLQRFPQKSGLMTHMMLHNGKPFKCQYCVKSFVSNHKLRHHLRSHGFEFEANSKTGQYLCPECYIQFFTVGALAEHRKVHLQSPNSSQSVDKSECYGTIISENAAKTAVSVLEQSFHYGANSNVNLYPYKVSVENSTPL